MYHDSDVRGENEPMPAALIAELYANRRDQIATRVAGQLKSSNAPHYRRLSVAELAQRADWLVDAFVASVAREPGRLAAYLEDVAEERREEGFLLGELQGALNVLEEIAWRLAVEHVPTEHQVEALSRVTTAIGAAKDRLARVYLERSLRAELRAEQLQRRIDVLMGGTDAPAVDEADLD
jgi:hypothetical protein